MIPWTQNPSEVTRYVFTFMRIPRQLTLAAFLVGNIDTPVWSELLSPRNLTTTVNGEVHFRLFQLKFQYWPCIWRAFARNTPWAKNTRTKQASVTFNLQSILVLISVMNHAAWMVLMYLHCYCTWVLAVLVTVATCNINQQLIRAIHLSRLVVFTVVVKCSCNLWTLKTMMYVFCSFRYWSHLKLNQYFDIIFSFYQKRLVCKYQQQLGNADTIACMTRIPII